MLQVSEVNHLVHYDVFDLFEVCLHWSSQALSVVSLLRKIVMQGMSQWSRRQKIIRAEECDASHTLFEVADADDVFTK